MGNLIEPNIHPVFVHFAYALMTSAALSLLIVSLAPARPWRETLKAAGDWMIAFGALAVLATVAAGFQAYYSVAHDGPSHAAMTMHRNWAVPTALALLVLSLWRWTRRKDRPSPLFALLFLAAAVSLSITAWWGGKLVYAHGLGVASLPAAGDGDGHDHEHDQDQSGVTQNDDDHAGHEHETESGHDHDGDPQGASPEAASSSAPAGTPEAAVEVFAAALKSGDAAALRALLMPDVVIAEGGGAERSLEEYAGHHMPADIEFSKAVETTVKDRRVIDGTDMATVITTTQAHGAFRGKAIHHQTMETMVLRRTSEGWRIAHIQVVGADHRRARALEP